MKSPLTVNVERNAANIELIKKLGSRNKLDSMAAAEAIAAILPQPILQVINQAAVISSLYTTRVLDVNEAPAVNLDPFFDARAKNMVQVWSQSQPGGTATNFVQGISKLIMQVFPLVSAASMNKNALRAGDIDYLGSVLTRAVQEILVQQEINAANILMGSAAAGRINFDSSDTSASNLVLARTATAGRFQMADFNKIMTAYDRVVASWAGGTPTVDKGGISVLLGSPEWMGQIRSISFQPQNNVAGSITTSGATAIAAPDSVREQILLSAGIPSLFGVELRKVWELGKGRAYNTLFSNYIGSTAFSGFGDSGTAAFSPTTEEVVVGLNPNMFDLIRLRQTEAGSEVVVTPDDTFTLRSDKIGFTFEVKEGYASVEGRAKFLLSM